MPQNTTTTTMIINQQGLPTIVSVGSSQQQHELAQAGSIIKSESANNKKATRVTKIRRTRQSRNPQQSVARRNERERNRVKLINKGFDVLRDNLPVEYLQTVAPVEKCAATGSVEGDSSPDIQANGKKSSKAKKFSKVDTLRAAIQHIRMLEELIRSADPDFELAKIPGMTSDESSLLGYDDMELDGCPLSIGQPASCASSTSASQNSHSTAIVHQHQSYQMSYEHHHQPSEQFVKLEPHIHQQIQPPPHAQQQQQLDTQFQIITRVHHNQHIQQQQQQQPELSSESDNSNNEQTQLWVQQQHQTTFDEQQQQQQQFHEQAHWYTNTFIQQQQQQQQQHLVLEQQLSPVSLDSPAGQMQHQHHQLNQHNQHNQQQQIWYAESSPSPQQSVQHQMQGAQMSQLAAFGAHQQHQIGLYSQ